jgi:hypothetical protein
LTHARSSSLPEGDPMTTLLILAAIAVLFFAVETYRTKPGDPL